MPRKSMPHNPDNPYHITARSNNKDWYQAPMNEVWSIMEDYLFFLHHAFKARILSFVLMNNHFHLIAQFPENNMSQAMHYFMRETSRQLGKRTNRINKIYGQRFKSSEINSYHYFLHAYKYVYRNPVDAKVCRYVEEYEYSTLSAKLGLIRCVIPYAEDSTLFESGIEKTLIWLNTSYAKDDREVLKKALYHQLFKIPKNRSDNSVHRLDNERS